MTPRSLDLSGPELDSVGQPGLAGRTDVRRAVRRLKSDHLLRNSFYIMLTTATMGVLGFGFWVLNARLFEPAQVGVATTLISAMSLISYMSLLGFTSSFIRFLPSSRDRDAEINTGLCLVFAAAVILSSGYVLAVPAFAPKLAFLRSSLPYAVGFVVLTAFLAVNLLTDAVFIAFRAAQYNFLVDGLIQGATKLALPLAFLGLGAYGIFMASGGAAVVAVVCSVVFMVRQFEYRPEVRIDVGAVRRTLSYSSANYVSNLLNIIPLLTLPIIVLDGRGAAQAGYYFIAFQVANLVNASSFAVCQALVAEGSYAGTDLTNLVRRSGKILCLVTVPSVALLSGAGPWLLTIFGARYSDHATPTVVTLGLAVPTVALNTWTAALLKLTRQLRALVWANALYVVVVCGLAVAWVGRGLAWVALAWLLGNLACGVFAGVAFWRGERQTSSAT